VVGSLRTYQLRLRIGRLLLQRVHRIERLNTQEYSKGFRKECMQEFFQYSKVAKESSGGLMLSKCSKEYGDRNTSREEHLLFHKDSRGRNRTVEILHGEIAKPRGP
jgi:hypothetical protein